MIFHSFNITYLYASGYFSVDELTSIEVIISIVSPLLEKRVRDWAESGIAPKGCGTRHDGTGRHIYVMRFTSLVGLQVTRLAYALGGNLDFYPYLSSSPR
jgi:hypothetical protein